MKWSNLLSADINNRGMALYQRAEMERKAGKPILPEKSDIFKALNLTRPENCKVVICGQDPYPTRGNANGLAFSVNPGMPIPASLKNIFKELHNDLGCPIPESGDLTPWAEQGVLLLNSSLTVTEGRPNSHRDWGWDQFTGAILKACFELPQPVVFLAWGGNARAAMAGLRFSEAATKRQLWSSHPSPMGATRGNEVVPAFLGSRPFSRTNALLEQMGSSPINWAI